jgi:hypothetical protein
MISAVVSVALLTTACGRSAVPEVAAAEPSAAAAPGATQGQRRPEQSTTPRANNAGTHPAARVPAAGSAAARPGTGPGRAAPLPRTPARTPAVAAYREFILPAGTNLSLELSTAIASDVSEVEDTVRGTLRNSVGIDGHEVLPAGTQLVGHVTETERAGRVKGRARVAFRFTSLRHDDERIPVRTDSIMHEAEATKGEDATKVGIGAGAGAVIGAVIGGKSGAAKGAAIGGAAGTGAVIATRGKEVRLEPGTDLSVRLAAPLAIRVRVQ